MSLADAGWLVAFDGQFKEEIRWLSEPGRDGLVVGDFGCGEALLAKVISVA